MPIKEAHKHVRFHLQLLLYAAHPNCLGVKAGIFICLVLWKRKYVAFVVLNEAYGRGINT